MTAENVAPMDGSGARFRRVVWLAALLATIVSATFMPVVRNGFVNYDDPDYVTANTRVLRGLTWENFVWAFRTDYAANWHPVTWLSHMVDASVFGQNAAGHHLVSVLIHALTTALVFFLFWKMTGATGRSFVLAALFGLHPLRVESVAWAAERKDVLAGFFAVATLLFYVRWVGHQSAQNRRRFFYYLASAFFFALGLMSKSMLVTLPGVMLLLDFWPLQRASFPMSGHKAWSLLREKIPFLLLALATGVITLLVQGNAGAVKTMTSYPALARWQNAVVSYGRHLGKMIYPADLAAFYPHPRFLAVDHGPLHVRAFPRDFCGRCPCAPFATLSSRGLALVCRHNAACYRAGSSGCAVYRGSIHLFALDRRISGVGLGNP